MCTVITVIQIMKNGTEEGRAGDRLARGGHGGTYKIQSRGAHDHSLNSFKQEEHPHAQAL